MKPRVDTRIETIESLGKSIARTGNGSLVMKCDIPTQYKLYNNGSISIQGDIQQGAMVISDKYDDRPSTDLRFYDADGVCSVRDGHGGYVNIKDFVQSDYFDDGSINAGDVKEGVFLKSTEGSITVQNVEPFSIIIAKKDIKVLGTCSPNAILCSEEGDIKLLGFSYTPSFAKFNMWSASKEVPPFYLCGLTGKVMTDPVICTRFSEVIGDSNTHYYDYEAIKKYFQKLNYYDEQIERILLPIPALKAVIERYCDHQQGVNFKSDMPRI